MLGRRIKYCAIAVCIHRLMATRENGPLQPQIDVLPIQCSRVNNCLTFNLWLGPDSHSTPPCATLMHCMADPSAQLQSRRGCGLYADISHEANTHPSTYVLQGSPVLKTCSRCILLSKSLVGAILLQKVPQIVVCRLSYITSESRCSQL